MTHWRKCYAFVQRINGKVGVKVGTEKDCLWSKKCGDLGHKILPHIYSEGYVCEAKCFMNCQAEQPGGEDG